MKAPRFVPLKLNRAYYMAGRASFEHERPTRAKLVRVEGGATMLRWIATPLAHTAGSFRGIGLPCLLCAAANVTCYDPLTAAPKNAATWNARNVEAYADAVQGPSPDTVLGWNLTISAGVARWHECVDRLHCTRVERQCAAEDLVGVSAIGQGTSPNGRSITVLRTIGTSGKIDQSTTYVQSGTLRLDSVAGSTVSGGLAVNQGGTTLSGTFTATICQ